MTILSISDSQNDSGVTLYSKTDNKIVFAINEEQITRKKMMYCFPKEIINLIKEYYKLTNTFNIK